MNSGHASAPPGQHIRGDEECWEYLQWDDAHTKTTLQPLFIPFHKEIKLRLQNKEGNIEEEKRRKSRRNGGENSLPIINIEQDGGSGEEEEELYEKIEAPKFVDFTASSDPYPPDDRYWFCLRVGCDQKQHEEEMDPEAISKNFVLWVMAAKSPNIQLHKALNKKASSVTEKCPLSVPAKPSKSRISRLAVISSFPQKMVDARGKVSSTPHPKVKQVAAKYLNTPRNKNCLPSPNSFRSVQNPKPTSITEPRNRTVAKALVFQSPKEVISIKTSSELHTPLTKICKGMKRLEITSQRKRILGYSKKSSKDIRRDPDKSLPLNPSKCLQGQKQGQGIV
ncbi:hypothetical protein LOK49_LG02G03248 [Camellia lanceoleosa]|uniref:Uncharacterized protein n=1 Tax=Camellia lanceoleosa TaxID=1840588 RepID=A0ACC0IVY5_9ERIC|nr:hypothetical protein LOK49_LG02G03248 [Camellia lanceoleosa]